MRASNLFFPTLKETPAEAELISHKLMLRAGLIKKLGQGLYSWLPLGLIILRKVEQVIRNEMTAINANEILMPLIQPLSLWHETGRANKLGKLMLSMQDRHKVDYCFSPTHEEVVTDIIRQEIKSYKQLPLCLYQINTKFRDEIRPRFGVMRAREFTMKDAYSFHVDESCLQKTYAQMYQAYEKIFSSLGLQYRAVLADGGDIGGNQSHEFHVLAESGEDYIAYSEDGNYNANLELASSKTRACTKTKALNLQKTACMPHSEISKQISIKFYQGSSAQQIFGLVFETHRTLNLVKLAKLAQLEQPLIEVYPKQLPHMAEFDLLEHKGNLLVDQHAAKLINFSFVNFDKTYQYSNLNWDRDLALPALEDLTTVKANDLSPDGSSPLNITKGIEVGHIFQLGKSYTDAMQAKIVDQEGKFSYMFMGCYGIGVSRIVAACIEQNHDAKGICWPKAMAPYQLVIVPVNYHKIEAVRIAVNSLYEALLKLNVSVILDDRPLRLGQALADWDLLGIPHRVLISEKLLAAQQIEYKERRAQAAKILDFDISSIAQHIRDILNANEQSI